MSQQLQVLSVKPLSGIGKKSGQPYKMLVAQCIIPGDEPLVGEFIFPKNVEDAQPGFYEADFAFGKGQDGRIGAVVTNVRRIEAAAGADKKLKAA